jgi:hypothetical protein
MHINQFSSKHGYGQLERAAPFGGNRLNDDNAIPAGFYMSFRMNKKIFKSPPVPADKMPSNRFVRYLNIGPHH